MSDNTYNTAAESKAEVLKMLDKVLEAHDKKSIEEETKLNAKVSNEEKWKQMRKDVEWGISSGLMSRPIAKSMSKTEAQILASKFYLCKPLPEGFDELDEQEVTDFIQDNKWEPFEDWEPHGIWELIEDLASEFRRNQLNF